MKKRPCRWNPQANQMGSVCCEERTMDQLVFSRDGSESARCSLRQVVKAAKWRWKYSDGESEWKGIDGVTVSRIKSFTPFLILFSLIVSVQSLSTISRRVVTTKQGIVQGVLGPSLRNSHWGYGGRPIVEIFKGIPYASAPVDTLRYETPAPLSNSAKNDVYIANISKPPCPTSYAEILERTKSNDPKRALRRTIHLEDCLYLDIFLPYTDKEKGDGLPVLVYANSQPEDSNEPWDGSSMAAIGNIMVIMFRYRVGVLGFVHPGFSEDIRSNFGLWDQLAALQWIKENVKMFGGDPSKITLMGYDLDASLAGILALSPISAQAYGGLFQRLILLNGSPFSPTSINHQPSDTTAHLASALKCPLHERAGELVTCLRYKTTPQLFQVAENMGTPLLTYRFAPNVDGTIVKEDFAQAGEGKINMELLGRYDLLCGIREGPTLPRMGQPPWQSLNLEKFVTAVIKLTLRLEPSSDPTAEVKRNLMRAIYKEYGSSPSMKDLVSDFLLVHPVVELLNAHSQTKKNTFFYVFKDYDPLRKNKQSEIPYIFSQDVYNWKYAGSTETIAELQSFEALIMLLANFVRTGDPNISDRSERITNAAKAWPKFTEEMGRYLEIGRDVALPSHYRESQVIFWSRIFPAVIKPFATAHTPDGNISGFDWGGSSMNQPFDLNVGGSGGRSQKPGSTFNGRYPHNNPNSNNVIAGSSMSQNTVVLIGCLLLLLNTLCFLGLFYQRERLKKAEVQLRRRYMESQPSTDNENEPGINDDESVYVRAPRPQRPLPARDAMSETETENGFGPDFLGPNYDPRTKVSRWMNLQNRVSDSPVLEMNPYSHPHLHPSAAAPSPMQIHLSSVQRLPKPADIIPHMPYQEPFQPAHTFDIPYADSRATSPSIATSTAYNNNLTTNNFNNVNRRSMPVFDMRETPTPSTTKRGSVLIVRDLDPVDDEMERMSVKYIPVKTGTLKRSVGVGVAIDEGQNGKIDISSSDEANGGGTSGKKITFADGL